MNSNADEKDPGERRGSLFLHDITKIDCALFDPSKGIFGQSWHLDLSLTGPLNGNGFVYDFSPLKKMVSQVLKSSLDHALVIPINSQSVQFRDGDREKGECWRLKSRAARGEADLEWDYTGPSGSVYPLRSIALNRHTIEMEISRLLRHRMPPEVQSITVALREEEVEPTEAVFRYTHGITSHDGLCQRLFHGHRSRIQIYVGDERRPDLEHYVARDVFNTNIHIACPSQIKSGPYTVGKRGTTREPLLLSYVAQQGRFEASIPSDRVFVVEHETSIECISHELARMISREEASGEKVKVICFEGIHKGGIAEV